MRLPGFDTLMVVAVPLLCVAGILGSIYRWGDIALGLDLKGGASIALRADLDKVIAERYAGLKQVVRSEVRGSREKSVPPMKYSRLDEGRGSVSITLSDADDLATLRKRLRSATNGEVDMEASGNTLKIYYSSDKMGRIKDEVVANSIEIIRRRVDSLGNKEASIQRVGEDRILVQIPGADDPERVKELVGKTAKMTFHLVDEDFIRSGEAARLPVDTELVSGVPIKKAIAVSGASLTDSRVQQDSQTGQWVVSTTFDALGAKAFAKLTTENVGRRFAIVLDGHILSTPVIQEPIPGGRGQISGGFTLDSANDLSTMLRSGALPAELEVVEERSVGAGLGADSIEKGTFASILGLVLVLVFMVAVYGHLGIFANLALLINIALIFAALSLTGATLTLPGIAGIALNIGMSVDSTILIYERMREEHLLGVSTIRSIENGFKGALSAIMDSNITTLASGFILLEFGNGPVKGFAITLILGILTSLFSNITCFRIMLLTWARSGRPKELAI